MEYVRQRYSVPAKRGGLVRFDGHLGFILSAKDGYLYLNLGADGGRMKVHPTWRMEYLSR